MIILYNFLLTILFLFFFPVFLIIILTNKNLKLGLNERFTIYNKSFLKKVANKKILWIHCSSVGEVNIAIQLLKSLKNTLDDNYKFLITTMTVTGYKNAESSNLFDFVTFIPFDFPFIVGRFFNIFSPEIILIAETEFWPNIFYNAKRRNIPLLVFNCRISDKTYKNYLKFKFFFNPILNCAQYFLCQNQLTIERLKSLNIDKNKLIFSKNIKFDIELPEYSKMSIFEEFKIPATKNLKIITAGSTHYNEEEVIINIFQKLNHRINNLFLIIAPRHPERVSEITKYLYEKQINFNLYSEKRKKENSPILIIDKIGVLTKAYAISNLCFIGGSLILRGGHNPLEAIYYKKPVISGKNIFNFREIYNLLLKENGVVLVANEDELYENSFKLLTNKEFSEKIAKNAFNVLKNNRGAISTTINYIKKCLS